jgi:ubiquinone/menaquinone biosynthesis C-methylase UbiE
MNERTFQARDAHRLEDPERLTWLPPDDVLALIRPLRGLTIADIGTGMGYFALPLARAVGQEGKVLAIDFQGEMIRRLERKVSESGAPGNLVILEGEAARTTLPDLSCDLVFMSNIWHELDNHPGVLGEVRRILKPEGRLAVLDWRGDIAPPPGPPPGHRVALESLRHLLLKHGWPVKAAVNVGLFSYLIITSPPPA